MRRIFRLRRKLKGLARKEGDIRRHLRPMFRPGPVFRLRRKRALANAPTSIPMASLRMGMRPPMPVALLRMGMRPPMPVALLRTSLHPSQHPWLTFDPGLVSCMGASPCGLKQPAQRASHFWSSPASPLLLARFRNFACQVRLSANLDAADAYARWRLRIALRLGSRK